MTDSRVLFSRLAAAAALAFGLAAAQPAFAQQPGVGARVGVSANPDQFVIGAHYDTGPIVDMLSFRPNVEVGVGDDRTTVAVNFEFAYWIPLRRAPWSVYAGGGPALNVYRYNEDRFGQRDSDVQPGFNLLIGLAHRRGLFVEAKLGLIDSPEAKFSVGYTWR